MHSANETAALRYLKISKLGSNAKAARPATFSVFFFKESFQLPCYHHHSFDRSIKTHQIARANRFQTPDWAVNFSNHSQRPQTAKSSRLVFDPACFSPTTRYKNKTTIRLASLIFTISAKKKEPQWQNREG
jgi:hypothetical protein